MESIGYILYSSSHRNEEPEIGITPVPKVTSEKKRKPSGGITS